MGKTELSSTSKKNNSKKVNSVSYVRNKDPCSLFRIRRASNHGKEMGTKLACPHLKVFWFSKGNSVGHSERKKKRE